MASINSCREVSVRLAQEDDIHAILALVLTSFRQFPLFDFLYSPLDDNFDYAHDTVFFWRRRLLLGLLDPESSVIVAEAPPHSLAIPANSRNDDEVYQKSLKAHEWTEKNRLLTSCTNGNLIVGFAIWRFRAGEREGSGKSFEHIRRSWYSSFRAQMIGWEVGLWRRIYQRKDQEPTRFAAYIEAEEKLEKNFYQEPCYYLDNLCVDFRYQRLGIGSPLLQWGLEGADEKKLCVGTEASHKGHGLYLKHGFEQSGWFTVVAHGRELRMPVLKLEHPQKYHIRSKTLPSIISGD